VACTNSQVASAEGTPEEFLAGSAGDGCVNAHDTQRAQTLAHLSFITEHPDPAEVAGDGGAGCDNSTGEVSAGREYYWSQLDPRRVIAFYQAVAAQDGWTSGTGAVDPSAQGLEASLCLTKQIDGSTAFVRLYFADSSEYGAYGDVYDVGAWFPGPEDVPGC
jgi:hypothetical protein